MPDILAGAQIFDVVFHPTHSTVYTGLLTGHVRAFAYDEHGRHQRSFSVRPSKRSCRALTLDGDGSHLYAAGKSKALNIIDTRTQKLQIRPKVHESAINRIKYLAPWMLATGDDDGVIKLWDPRQKDHTHAYRQHFDYITDFLWLEDKRHLVATSGDGTLSVMDTRSKKPEPIAQSEDQEDELLSIVAIKGDSKVVVGTQIGILSIFNRNKGWGDCVDRIPGHPHSIDTLCAVPSGIPNVDAHSTILTGSSDGFVRAIEVLPTKLLGVVADHGEWPVERIAIGSAGDQLTIDEAGSDRETDGRGRVGGKGRANGESDDSSGEEDDEERHQRTHWWIGSVGHEERVKMTDLGAFFRKDQLNHTKGVDREDGSSDDSESDSHAGSGLRDDVDSEEAQKVIAGHADDEDVTSGAESQSEGEPEVMNTRKRKKKKEKDLMKVKKRGKREVDVESTFFDGL